MVKSEKRQRPAEHAPLDAVSGCIFPGLRRPAPSVPYPTLQSLQDDAAPRAARREGRRAARRGEGVVLRDELEEEDDGAAPFVPSRLSKRILDAAREQLAGDDGEEGGGAGGGDDGAAGGGSRRVRFASRGAVSVLGGRKKLGSSGGATAEDEDEDGDDSDGVAIDFEEGMQGGAASSSSELPPSFVRVGGEDYLDVSLPADYDDASGADAAVLRRFMPEEAGGRRTLADIIMEKLAAAEAAREGGGDALVGEDGGRGDAAVAGSGLDARIVDVYTEVGRFLASYKSGAVPKVFKVVPSLPNWEEVLFLTNPGTWTPHATFAATRIFVSNLNAAKAQRFGALVLLPKCRDDIFMHKRLNFHLYLALRKMTYKPAAFYKGILLPLAAGGDCTLREAVIFASVLSRSSVPQLHSAAALMKFATGMPYSGAVSIFLRTLIDKKYALPFIAVDALAEHFLSFHGQEGPLPVIWHQSFLALAQRYRGDLQRTHVDALRALVAEHHHHAMGPEIRRELLAGPARGEAVSVAPPAGGVAVGAGAPAPGRVVRPRTGGSGPGMDVEY